MTEPVTKKLRATATATDPCIRGANGVLYMDEASQEVIRTRGFDVLPTLVNPKGVEDDDENTASPTATPIRRNKQQQQTDIDTRIFTPRAWLLGEAVKLPYIWITVTGDSYSDEPILTVKESTIVCPSYRIILVTHTGKSRSLHQVDLPVYPKRSRRLSSLASISKSCLSHTFEGASAPYMLHGNAALMGAIEAGHTGDCQALIRPDEDRLEACLSETTNRVTEIIFDFHVDLTLHWDASTNKFLSATGVHAATGAIYYILLTVCNGKNVATTRHDTLYIFHADTMRDVGEATGLDLHYKHPFIA